MKKKSYTGGIVVYGKAQQLLQNFWFGLLAFGLVLALPALTLAAPVDLDPKSLSYAQYLHSGVANVWPTYLSLSPERLHHA